MDIAALAGKHKPHVLAAEELLVKAEQVMQAESTSDDAVSMLCLYLLQVRVVHHICRKEDPTRGTFTTLSGIGHQFVTELATHVGRKIESPWQPQPSTKAKPTSDSNESENKIAFVSFAAGRVSNVADLLLERGYKLNDVVQRVSDNVRFHIQDIGELVTLEDDVGAQIKLRPDALIKPGKFRKIASEAGVVYMENWMERAEPSADLAWQSDLRSSMLKIAVDQLHHNYFEALDGLAIVTHPTKSRGVWTTREFKAKELTLVPLTTNIAFKVEDDKNDRTAGAVATQERVTCGRTGATKVAYLARKFMEPPDLEEQSGKLTAAAAGHVIKEEAAPFIVPFWLVAYTGDDEDERGVNMYFANETVEVMERKIRVPIIRNSRKIAKDVMLICYRSDLPKPKAAAKQSAAARVAPKQTLNAAKKAKKQTA